MASNFMLRRNAFTAVVLLGLLIAAEGWLTQGVMTMGKLDEPTSTNLEVLTLNTHLAGDEIFIPSWKDYERADDIAGYFQQLDPMPDVVGFQEIWDEDLFLGGDGANGIRPQAGYPHGDHGDKEGFILNSGAALMSLFPLNDFAQVEFVDKGGFPENAAAKGWVEATLSKEGFEIGVFNTHLNADDQGVRSLQVEQLMQRVDSYRMSHPHRVVVVMGDFNIYGEGPEYQETLAPKLARHRGSDAARTSAGFSSNNSTYWTLSDSNPLALYFDANTVSGRLDYIFYFSSLDGRVDVVPTSVDVLQFTGRSLSEGGLVTNQSSDHWAVRGEFTLTRQP